MSKSPVTDVHWRCDHWTYPEGYSEFKAEPEAIRCPNEEYAEEGLTPPGWTERVEKEGPCGLTNYYRNVLRQYCPEHSEK